MFKYNTSAEALLMDGQENSPILSESSRRFRDFGVQGTVRRQ